MRTSLLITLFFISVSLSAAPLKTRALSMEQEFIITDDAPQGEYVGTVKVFPEFSTIGESVQFSLQHDESGAFDISSSGLLTLKEKTDLEVGSDTLTIEVSKKGYRSYQFPVIVTVLASENCLFVDPAAVESGDGTRANPLNSLPQFEDNTIALLKRGTTLTVGGQITINNKDNILIGSYGSGDMPILAAGDVYLFRFYSGVAGEGPTNCTVRDLEVTSADSAVEHPSDDYSNWMNAICYTSNQQGNFTIAHCEIHHTHNGVTINTSSGTEGEGVSLLWNHIHDVAQEGIYLQEVRGVGRVVGNKIERVNLLWNFNQTEAVSSGDGVQTYKVDSVDVRHNYIDKSFTGNKFNVIAQYNANTVTGNEWVEICDNYLIGNAGGSNNSLSGAIIYADFAKGKISRNSFIGLDSTRGIASANSSDECEISYNLFTNCGDAINDPKANVYNNLFYGCLRATARSENDFINNIIFFTAPGQMVYSRHLTLNADYNCYNQEMDNMFGDGFHTLQSMQPSKEQNSIEGDPLFLDANVSDYRIWANSPAYKAGTGTTIEFDFAKQSVGSEPNMGIYEGAIGNTSLIDNSSHTHSSAVNYTVQTEGRRVQISLSDKQLDGQISYRVVTCSGKTVHQQKSEIKSGTFSVSLPVLSSGVYLFVVEDSGLPPVKFNL